MIIAVYLSNALMLLFLLFCNADYVVPEWVFPLLSIIGGVFLSISLIKYTELLDRICELEKRLDMYKKEMKE